MDEMGVPSHTAQLALSSPMRCKERCDVNKVEGSVACSARASAKHDEHDGMEASGGVDMQCSSVRHIGRW